MSVSKSLRLSGLCAAAALLTACAGGMGASGSTTSGSSMGASSMSGSPSAGTSRSAGAMNGSPNGAASDASSGR